MTELTSVTKTYDLSGEEPNHNGYFITSNNYRLKWATKWQWEHYEKLPMFKINLDRVLSSLKDAQ